MHAGTSVPLYILFLYVLGEALAATAANSCNPYAAAAAKDTNFFISTNTYVFGEALAATAASWVYS